VSAVESETDDDEAVTVDRVSQHSDWHGGVHNRELFLVQSEKDLRVYRGITYRCALGMREKGDAAVFIFNLDLFLPWLLSRAVSGTPFCRVTHTVISDRNLLHATESGRERGASAMEQEPLVENWQRTDTSALHPDNPYQTNGHESAYQTLRLVGQARQNEVLLRELKCKLGLGQLIGESPAFLIAVRQIPAMARCEANVLIAGETGTGKEVCARAIHYLSPRSSQPFIAVNCGAIPAELIENELFGHERGAYTDATVAKPGLIQEAEGGTLFLDEIDCLPLLAQVKLLRFLQEKEYRPLGATKAKKASVRVIAATNADLEDAVQQRRLRRDLYYRLNILPMMLPPLRQRQGDMVLLARHFLAKFAEDLGKPVPEFSSEALHLLLAYSWPGNVRELEHTIERVVAMSEEIVIGEADLTLFTSLRVPWHATFRQAKERAITQFEEVYIKEVLLAHGGNISKAAQAAGKNRRAFWQLMRKHGIEVQNRKRSPSSYLDKF